jgi:hypothetical protein
MSGINGREFNVLWPWLRAPKVRLYGGLLTQYI